MKRFLRLIWLPAALLTIAVVAGPSTAQAGGFSLQIGGGPFYGGGFGVPSRSFYGGGYGRSNFGGYNSYRPSYGYGSGYGHGYGHAGYGRSYRPSYGHPNHPHLDYHPPIVVPHGNHYDVVPGHYDTHHGRH